MNNRDDEPTISGSISSDQPSSSSQSSFLLARVGKMQPTQTSQQSRNVTNRVDLSRQTEPDVWIQLPDLSTGADRRSRRVASHDSLPDPSIPSIPIAELALNPAESDHSQETFYLAESHIIAPQSDFSKIESSQDSTAQSAGNPFAEAVFVEPFVEDSKKRDSKKIESPLTPTQATGLDSAVVGDDDLASTRDSSFPPASLPFSANQATGHTPFAMSESSESTGLVGWFARMAPAMILLALIGSATLLLWFLLSGGTSEPMIDDSGPADWHDSDRPGAFDSTSTAKSGATLEATAQSADSASGSNDPNSSRSDSTGIQDSGALPSLGSPDGKGELDLELQSAWPPAGRQRPGAADEFASPSNEPVMARLTGTIEPLERVVRQPPSERQANRPNPTQSKQ